MINVAVLGYGTVGSGVVEVIMNNADIISKRIGEDITIKKILDLRDFPGDKYENKVTHEWEDILKDDEISVVCETMGGVGAAYKFTKEALSCGKAVCTSNKELVAAHGPELISLAKQNITNYFFEASVGGGIPIIRPILNALTAENIQEINGILNGTTNYILTKMEREGAKFETVLKEAQELGYAEKDPTADVEGFDAVRKIAILSSISWGKNVNYEGIYTEGITKITPEDFKYAKAMNKTIKLIALGKKTEEGFCAMVSPRMISKDNPLYCAQDVFNAILVKSDMLGDSMYYGKGAGKLPTASAVVADVVEAAKNKGKHLSIFWSDENQIIDSKDKFVQQYFIRVSNSVSNEAINNAFGEVEYVTADGVANEKAFITKKMSEADYNKASGEIGDIISMIRA